MKEVAVIGGGPAGLMAAEVMATNGIQVTVYDAKPSVGRKFLLAGKGGLNITHAEPWPRFQTRYHNMHALLRDALQDFDNEKLRTWVHQLGIETFVGSSGRVFPAEMKSAPLLRVWLHRLRGMGVRFRVRHRWTGWARNGSALQFETPAGPYEASADATILALGGGSWPQLGSDGSWVTPLQQAGVFVSPLKPANCGFDVTTHRNPAGWSPHFGERHAGVPIKNISGRVAGTEMERAGEVLITAGGMEGGMIYALSSELRQATERDGKATLEIDLLPQTAAADLATKLSKPRGARSMSSHLQSTTGLHGAKAALLRELTMDEDWRDPARLASKIKCLNVTFVRPRPLAEAISSAGGVLFDDLDDHYMLRARAGTFCAGEMLDWDAPTGGYLLTACLATGRAAGLGTLQWLNTGSKGKAHGRRRKSTHL